MLKQTVQKHKIKLISNIKIPVNIIFKSLNYYCSFIVIGMFWG